jgi:hypothetical protein
MKDDQELHDRGRDEEARSVRLPHESTHGGAATLLRQVTSLDVKDAIRVQNDPRALSLPARVVSGVADRFQRLPERR